jgi:hypothetical protein
MRSVVRNARVVRGRGRGYGFGSAARVNLLVLDETVSSRRFAGAYASPPTPHHPGPADTEPPSVVSA